MAFSNISLTPTYSFIRPLFVDFEFLIREFLIRDFHRNNAGGRVITIIHYLYCACAKELHTSAMTKSPWIYRQRWQQTPWISSPNVGMPKKSGLEGGQNTFALGERSS